MLRLKLPHVHRAVVLIKQLIAVWIMAAAYIGISYTYTVSGKKWCHYIFMAAHSNGQAIIFCTCGNLLSFFLAYSQQSEIGCVPYFHT